MAVNSCRRCSSRNILQRLEHEPTAGWILEEYCASCGCIAKERPRTPRRLSDIEHDRAIFQSYEQAQAI